jgi:hypothetical protein
MKNLLWKIGVGVTLLPLLNSGFAYAAATPSTEGTASALDQAVTWMQQHEAKKMHGWTAIVTYAGTGVHPAEIWSKSELLGLKASTDYSRVILAMLASGLDPHQYDQLNLVQKLAQSQITTGQNAGKFADNVDGTGTSLINNQSYAIIALEDAGNAHYNRIAAANWLIGQQNSDGGFGYSSKYHTSDTDDTAAAIVALSLLGYDSQSTPIQRALTYLKSQQTSDGGFKNGGKTSNADSTGVALDALAALGIRPSSWSVDGHDPVSALISLRDAQSGGFKYDNTGSEWSGVSGLSTRDAVFGLASASSQESIYQRLHFVTFDHLNAYWEKIYLSGGAWDHHKWKSWSALRPMAIAGTYVSQLTSNWQTVIHQHGQYTRAGGQSTWQSWDSSMALQALENSFGWDTLHLNLMQQ